jgi:hypothetical protein
MVPGTARSPKRIGQRGRPPILSSQPSAGGTFADWVRVFLDSPPPTAADWREIAAILRDAYRHIAPRSLVKLLDG